MAASNPDSLAVDVLVRPSDPRAYIATLRQYYRLTKPGIIYGNLITAFAGYLFASRWQIQWLILASLTGGIALIIGSACVFNNYIDRRIDKKMARTAQRALVTGAISRRSAIAYAVGLGILGFLTLSFTNRVTMAVGAVAMLSYVVFYGIAKRRTPYGTLVGTLPGAASLVAGYTAAVGRVDVMSLFLLLVMITWQMPHFYAIATYRRNDYAAASLPVWPVKKGLLSTKIQILWYVAAFMAANVLLALFGPVGYVYILVMVPVGAYWFWQGVRGFGTTDDAQWARNMFKLSLVVLLSLSFMLATGPLLP